MVNKNPIHKVRKIFDDWSERYDSDARHYHWSAPRTLAELVLRETPADWQSSREVIDMACGTGILGEYFIRRGFWVDGLDLSWKMLAKAAERRYRKVMVSNLKQDRGSTLAGYDIAVCCGVLGEYVDLELMVIDRIIASLKAEAIIGFTVRTDSMPVSKQERETSITKLLHDQGFEICGHNANTFAYFSLNYPHSPVNYDYYCGSRGIKQVQFPKKIRLPSSPLSLEN